MGATRGDQVGRLEVVVGRREKQAKKTKKGDRMAQRNRSNLPEARRIVVVGLVEALKLGGCGSFTSTGSDGTCDKVSL